MTSIIGQTVSHYRILEKLGSGGMGVVYKARDLSLDRFVVLKFLPPDRTRDPEARQRFVHEAKAASGLDHTNICVVHEISETDDGQIFVVMAFYEGETLKQHIERGPLSAGETISAGLQIARGLAAAHEHGIIHRDIKSANIIVTKEGVVKLLDFGLAKLAGRTQITREGSTLGTVAYMSPEQARGEETDQRTDIWSLGAVLYEMVTGHLPFRGDYEQVVIHQILNQMPEPFDTPGSAPDEGLHQIIGRCLQKDINARYTSASDIAAELSQLQTVTTPEYRPGRAPGGPRRRKRLIRAAMIALGILAFACAAYFLAGTLFQTTEAPPPGDSQDWDNSIAVLPFKDFSAAGDQEFFCDAMTDAVIDNLSQAGRLKAISLTSVMRFKTSPKDIREVGADLGVANILEGSIQREAGRIRVRAQLVHAGSGVQLWSQTYDQDLHSVFEIQDQISRSIAEAMNLVLPATRAGSRAQMQSVNMEAYEHWMRGMHYLKSRYVISFREEDFRSSLDMFNRALALDSLYAAAYYGRAWAYEFHYQVTGDDEDSRRMQENCEQAWRLDPASPTATATMGYALYEYRHEREKAFEYLGEALQLNPNNADVNFLAGICFLYQGLYERGVLYLEKAFELDPYFFWTPYKLGFCHMHSGRFEKAERFFKRYFTLAPIEPLVFPGQYVALNIWMGKLRTADSILAQGASITPNAWWVRKHQAILHALRGEKDRALGLYRNSEVHALLGMADEAIRELDLEIRGSTSVPHIYYQDLLHNPWYDRIRHDSRFVALVQREKRHYEEALILFGNFPSR